MDLGNSGLNPSSLIDLKAELSKKYETFKKAKLTQNVETPKHTSFKNKNEATPKVKKPVPVVKSENPEEELALKKSRLALEAKTKFYEKITSNRILLDDEESERYLVDFQRKVLYDTPECEATEKHNKPNDDNSTETVTPDLSDLERKAYTAQESASEKTSKPVNRTGEWDPDQPVHYQNVQDNEVRDYGTAYFAFSTDETKRKEQMEELSNMRQETEAQRFSKERLLRKRKAGLQARLAKICERRNIDKTVVEAYTVTQDTQILDDLPPVNTTDLSNIPLPKSPEVSEKKVPKIRPWDVGKIDLQPPTFQKYKPKTQKDWIEERRQERQTEFAPPTSYRK